MPWWQRNRQSVRIRERISSTSPAASSHSCTVFVCEDLNIKGMMKNRHLSKAIASAGWYGFFQKLSYKLEKKGGMVLKAGRFFASSQIVHAVIRIRKSKISGSGAGSVRNAEWSTTVTGMRRRISFTKGSGS